MVASKHLLLDRKKNRR